MTTKRRIMSEKKENEEDSQEFVAKCANHLSLALLRRRENQSELCYESDEDNNSVLKKSSISTRCEFFAICQKLCKKSVSFFNFAENSAGSVKTQLTLIYNRL